MHRVGTEKLAFSTRLGGLQAEESDHVGQPRVEGIVGVEGAFCIGDGEAGTPGYALTGIAHVVEQGSPDVLLERRSYELTYDPVGGSGPVGMGGQCPRRIDDDEATARTESVDRRQ